MEKCPCGTELAYENCCGSYISGKKSAPTAEALMRARYCAYTKGEIDFIKRTQDAKTRKTFDEEGAKDWSLNSKWFGLELKSVQNGKEGDQEGQIEFVAKYEYKGTPSDHHELAFFKREGKEWFFVDGKVLRGQIVRSVPKVGRNEDCPCGSGKKYKKCCLK